jgi:hypothetical protein
MADTDLEAKFVLRDEFTDKLRKISAEAEALSKKVSKSGDNAGIGWGALAAKIGAAAFVIQSLKKSLQTIEGLKTFQEDSYLVLGAAIEDWSRSIASFIPWGKELGGVLDSIRGKAADLRAEMAKQTVADRLREIDVAEFDLAQGDIVNRIAGGSSANVKKALQSIIDSQVTALGDEKEALRISALLQEKGFSQQMADGLAKQLATAFRLAEESDELRAAREKFYKLRPAILGGTDEIGRDIFRDAGRRDRSREFDLLAELERQKPVDSSVEGSGLLDDFLKNSVPFFVRGAKIARDRAIQNLEHDQSFTTGFARAVFEPNQWHDIGAEVAQGLQQNFETFFFNFFESRVFDMQSLLRGLLTLVQQVISRLAAQQLTSVISGAIGGSVTPSGTPASQTVGAPQLQGIGGQGGQVIINLNVGMIDTGGADKFFNQNSDRITGIFSNAVATNPTLRRRLGL